MVRLTLRGIPNLIQFPSMLVRHGETIKYINMYLSLGMSACVNRLCVNVVTHGIINVDCKLR